MPCLVFIFRDQCSTLSQANVQVDVLCIYAYSLLFKITSAYLLLSGVNLLLGGILTINIPHLTKP